MDSFRIVGLQEVVKRRPWSHHPARELMYLFRLFNSRKSTDPLDYVYGLLGLLNVEELPRSLLPNYKLDYARVCQDYAQYIIENTNDLEIIETYRSDFKPPLPASWVPDV